MALIVVSTVIISVTKHDSPPGTWTVFEVLSGDADRPTRQGIEGMYRIKSLQPGTAYEVNLVGQNAVGQSDPYVVVFRTSDLIGTSGRLLHEPVSQPLHGKSGGRSIGGGGCILHLLLTITSCLLLYN